MQVTSMGEMLVDMVSVQSGVSVRDAPGFIKAAGGAPANVAVGVARLGCTSAFIGKVGCDDMGQFLVDTLASEGVNTQGVLFDTRTRTALAFVSLGQEGEREFLFYRHPSADMLLSADEIDTELISQSTIFHHGSISLIDEMPREATRTAVTAARAAGALVSYDPNVRLALWPDPATAREIILSQFSQADLVKLNRDELEFLTGITPVEQGVQSLWATTGHECPVVVTAGPMGCRLIAPGTSVNVAGFRVSAVDTTGAGDAFMAGLLTGLIGKSGETEMPGCQRTSLRESIDDLDVAEWREILSLANLVGALCTQRKGAIPGLPSREDIARAQRDFG